MEPGSGGRDTESEPFLRITGFLSYEFRNMGFSAIFLRTANAVVSFVVAVFLAAAGAYSVYALWDNNQVYASAENVQADMIRLKPQVEIVEHAEGEPAAVENTAFTELLAVNSDVRAWVSTDNTNIDYPVLQGETNLTYINTDVYGNFALAGSIFLDCRSDPEFEDAYSLLYGHHMANSGMFGDLDLYKDESFFDENRTGMLILPDRVYDLEIYACMLVKASDPVIFRPDETSGDLNKLFDYCEQNAMYLHKDTVDAARNDPGTKILALSTCSSEFTDARTIVLAVMKPHKAQ